MLILYYVWVGLLAAKLVWNFSVPYASKRAASVAAAEGKEPSRTSLMLGVEWILICFASVTAGLGSEATPFPFGVGGTFLVGAAAVLGSYAHFLFFSMVVGWRQKRRRRDGDAGGGR